MEQHQMWLLGRLCKYKCFVYNNYIRKLIERKVIKDCAQRAR